MQLPPLMKHLSLFPQPLLDYVVMPGIYSFLTPNERHAPVVSALKLRTRGACRTTSPLLPDSSSQSESYGIPGSQTAWLTSSQIIFASHHPPGNPVFGVIKVEKAEISERVKPANLPVPLLSIYSPRPHPPKTIRAAARR